MMLAMWQRHLRNRWSIRRTERQIYNSEGYSLVRKDAHPYMQLVFLKVYHLQFFFFFFQFLTSIGQIWSLHGQKSMWNKLWFTLHFFHHLQNTKLLQHINKKNGAFLQQPYWNLQKIANKMKYKNILKIKMILKMKSERRVNIIELLSGVYKCLKMQQELFSSKNFIQLSCSFFIALSHIRW